MQIDTKMTSSRPYLIRALFEWINDNGLTPHIVVDADQKEVVVPKQFVEDGKIVLNISPTAVNTFDITNEFICFSARFSGKAEDIFVPITSVMALYAKENGQGMVFNEEKNLTSKSDKDTQSSISNDTKQKEEESSRPKLRLV